MAPNPSFKPARDILTTIAPGANFGSVEGRVLQIDAAWFCEQLVAAARQWAIIKAEDDNVLANMPNLVRLRPEGLHPYIVNVPRLLEGKTGRGARDSHVTVTICGFWRWPQMWSAEIASVCAKSLPLNNSGYRVARAREYEKQSPMFKAAGWRPLPYFRNASIARVAWCAVTGTISASISAMNPSRAARPVSPLRPSMTKVSSTLVAADRRRGKARAMAEL